MAGGDQLPWTPGLCKALSSQVEQHWTSIYASCRLATHMVPWVPYCLSSEAAPPPSLPGPLPHFVP